MTCWGANDEGQAAGETADLIGTTRAATPAGIVAMSLGDAHTCAIHGTARTLSCWGNDSFGQLGDGTVDAGRRGPTNVAVALPRGTCSVAAGDRHTCAALTDGSVFCWGSDGNGQLGGGGDTATPRALALPL
ncbi:MAG: hypothetical protein H6722_32300 [Sandaracinus sp.]|nr:hypothetical protein [Sandaracinus sp.]